MDRLGEAVRKLEIAIAGLALVGIVVMIGVQVFFRFALNSPIPWAEELGRYLHIWVVFLGAAAVESSRGHIRVGYFADRIFRGQLKRGYGLVLHLIAFATGLVLVFSVYKGLTKLYNITTPAMGLPMTLFYVPTVLGAFGLALHSIVNALAEGKGQDRRRI